MSIEIEELKHKIRKYDLTKGDIPALARWVVELDERISKLEDKINGT